jgi:ATP-dependent RNA helicase DDX24/MAK5
LALVPAAILASLDAVAKQSQEGDPSSKKGKKQKQQQQQQQQQSKKRKQTAVDTPAAADGNEDVGALKARLQQLEAENRALKKQRKQIGTAVAADSNEDDDDAAAAAATAAAAAAAAGTGIAGDAAKQQRKQARKQQRLEKLRQKRELQKQHKREQRQQQHEEDAEPVPDLDMTAWERFDLNPELVKALARRGFSAPTPIQDAVLEPAIRDRRDVIGAAQTGSGKTLAFGLPILQVSCDWQQYSHRYRCRYRYSV